MKSIGLVSPLDFEADTRVAGKLLGAMVMDVRFRGHEMTREDIETATGMDGYRLVGDILKIYRGAG